MSTVTLPLSNAARRLRLCGVCAIAAALGVLGKHWVGPGATIAVGQGEDFFGTIFLLLAPRVFFLRTALWKIAVPILTVLLAIELSQLSSAPLLEAARAHWLGRRIVGTTFEWFDLLAYTLATIAALTLDRALNPPPSSD